MEPRGTIAIVGAGLGGLTAALALARGGWRVRVFEQAPMLGEVGAGITVSPGSARGLAGMGVGPAILAASLPVPDVAFAHWRTGALLAGAFDDGAPSDRGFDTPRHIHRADLHAILLAAVRALGPTIVATGRRLIEVDADDDGVDLRFADGAVARADFLIGADGARSTVRRLLFDDLEPEFAGQVAFRCLVPRAQAAPFMRGGNAVVTIGPSRIFHRYAIRGGDLVNVIGIARSDAWRGEGWNTRATVDEFLGAYAGFNADVLGLIRRAPADTLIRWGLFVRPPIADWSRGRATLLGDAAHPILPFLGLGAALAIEDALVLARALDAAPDATRAFAAYEGARIARVDKVRRMSIRQGEIIQSADPDRADLGAAPAQDENLFDYDPAMEPLHL